MGALSWCWYRSVAAVSENQTQLAKSNVAYDDACIRRAFYPLYSTLRMVWICDCIAAQSGCGAACLSNSFFWVGIVHVRFFETISARNAGEFCDGSLATAIGITVIVLRFGAPSGIQVSYFINRLMGGK